MVFSPVRGDITLTRSYVAPTGLKYISQLVTHG
jgi:hypothetical protein